MPDEPLVDTVTPAHPAQPTAPRFTQTKVLCGNCGQPAILETPISPLDKTLPRILPHGRNMCPS